MGPRSFNRGNRTRQADSARPDGFNGAAVFQPRKCLRRRMPCVRLHAGFNGAAVFQPRKCRRTCRFPIRTVGFNGAAVFQPRKWQFGELSVAMICSRLQWGRGLSTAEMSQPDVQLRQPTRRFNGAAVFQPRKCTEFRASASPAASLQWGRGLSTAEMAIGAERA